MPLYRYRAIDEVGVVVRGQLNVDNPQAVEEYLRTCRLDVLSVRRVRPVQGKVRGDKGSAADVYTFLFLLQHLLEAGLPLLESLSLLQSQVKPLFAPLIFRVRQLVQGGDQLSVAMPKAIVNTDRVTVALIRAGEQGGLLPQMLRLAANRLQMQAHRRRQLQTLLAYPALTFALALVALLVLLVSVVPELALFLHGMEIQPPWYTTALLGLSALVREHGAQILFGSLLLLLMFAGTLLVFPTMRVQSARLLLKCWVVGDLTRKIQLCRFMHAIGALYDAGVPLLDALYTANSVVLNPILRSGLLTAQQSIEQGMTLSQALAKTGCFPPLMIEMLHVGEQTGSLSSVLQHLVVLYEQDIQTTEDRLLVMIQPATMILLGGMLAWLLMAVFGVIYDNLDRMVL